MKDTELTYIEHLTRMVGIKYEIMIFNFYREQLNRLPKQQSQKLKLTEDVIESLLPKAEKLLSLHRGILQKICKWSIKNDTLIDVFININE
jgi:hypothetical protein